MASVTLVQGALRARVGCHVFRHATASMQSSWPGTLRNHAVTLPGTLYLRQPTHSDAFCLQSPQDPQRTPQCKRRFSSAVSASKTAQETSEGNEAAAQAILSEQQWTYKPPSLSAALSWTLFDRVRGSALYAAMIAFVAVPIWIAQGFLALLGVTLGRKQFFKQKDRSSMTFSDPFPVEHKFLTVNGLRLHAVSAGHGRGKPLMLCLHGFPELWFSWRRQLQEFQEDYEVVAIDMRGYGESDRPKDRRAYDLSELTADVSEVIKALGHQDCVLLAHDWGGFVAWFTAALYPAAVKQLIVMGLPHPTAWKVNLDLDQMRRSWYFMFFQCPWLPEFLLTAQDVALFDGCFRSGPIAPRSKGAVSDEDIERYKKAFQEPGAPTAAINYYRALIDCATWHDCPPFRKASQLLAEGSLSMPTLMLYADSDTALGTQLVQGTDRFVKDLELHVLENCSHWVQQDKPEEVHRLMRGFLKRTEPAAAVSAVAA